MKKPKLKDYSTSGSMIAPYGGYDYEKYSQAQEKYIKHIKRKLKLLNITVVMERTLREATPDDIVTGKTVYLSVDSEIHTKVIDEVLRPSDKWKAFCADDGCRYGLDGLYVL